MQFRIFARRFDKSWFFWCIAVGRSIVEYRLHVDYRLQKSQYTLQDAQHTVHVKNQQFGNISQLKLFIGIEHILPTYDTIDIYPPIFGTTNPITTKKIQHQNMFQCNYLYWINSANTYAVFVFYSCCIAVFVTFGAKHFEPFFATPTFSRGPICHTRCRGQICCKKSQGAQFA